MAQMPPEQLLAEIEDVIRTLPDLTGSDISAWAGRAQALVAMWDGVQGIMFDGAIRALASGSALRMSPATREVPNILHRARYDLLYRCGATGAGTKVIDRGQPFDYFDELRKVVQQARAELFFVDPYLNEDFVARYVPFIEKGVLVRLLGRENMKTLRPAVEIACSQFGLKIEARAGSGFHDRFVFVDGEGCYQSGASFHQGGRSTPTTLTPILDAARTLMASYDELWSRSK